MVRLTPRWAVYWVLVLSAGCVKLPSSTEGFACRSQADCDENLVCAANICSRTSVTPGAGPAPSDAGALIDAGTFLDGGAFRTDGGFPSALTTGVPPGSVLVPSIAGVTLAVDGGTLDGVDLQGCVTVKANGVTIQRSRIRCSGSYAIQVLPGVLNTVVQDVEIDGLGAPSGRAVGGGGQFLLQRDDIHAVQQGVELGSQDSVVDSFIHDLASDSAVGVTANAGSQLLIRHNTILRPSASGACVQLTDHLGSLSNVTTDSNFLNGGNYTVVVSVSSASNLRVTDNVLGPAYQSGTFNLSSGVVVSGNVYADGGAVSP